MNAHDIDYINSLNRLYNTNINFLQQNFLLLFNFYNFEFICNNFP